MFRLTELAIDHQTEVLDFSHLEAGGLVFFEGRVRNHNNALKVKSLEYQVYESMAIKEGQKILERTLKRFDLHFAKCIHRFGHLKLGEVAIWVGVSSSHRREAFEACQFVVDEVKSFVPIWKKEHYELGPSSWIACHRCREHNEQEIHHE
jgi:molybdopterin synthase catalytic subunit